MFIIIASGMVSLFYHPTNTWGQKGKKMNGEEGKRALMIIAHRDFRDEEFREPKEVLEKNGFQVDVASSSTDKAIGMLGLEYKPDLLLSAVKVEDYSIIAFIGGAGSREYWEDKKAHEIARESFTSGKVLGAICIAPVILANAGILNGKRVTVFQSMANRLTSKGAQYTGKAVERDGLLITAIGPSAAKDFGLALIEALSGQSEN